MDMNQIREHMEVKSSDGEHVGTVDRLEGSEIKLTKNDRAAHGGHHHFIPTDWIDHIDAHVHLSKTSQDVKAHWQHGTA
ncbi:hypothetical protein EV560_105473 [Bosea sp. BK604]|nr:hypothetical protein EV560_105473 [Bosea sp. BK604]